MSKPTEPTPRVKAAQDPEVLAISRMLRILSTLDLDGAERVAEYVYDKAHKAAMKVAPDGNG